MDKDQYIALFEKLDFFCLDQDGNECPVATAYQAGRVLRHRTVRTCPTSTSTALS